MQPLQGISKVTWEGYFSVRVSAQSVTELTQSKRLNKCWLSGFNKLPHQVQMDRTDFLPFAPDEEACFSPKSWCLPSCVSLLWINSVFLGSMFSTNELLLFIFKLKLEIMWQIFVI